MCKKIFGSELLFDVFFLYPQLVVFQSRNEKWDFILILEHRLSAVTTVNSSEEINNSINVT